MEITDKAKTTSTSSKTKSTCHELTAVSLKKLQELLGNDDCTAGEITSICHDIVIFADKFSPVGYKRSTTENPDEANLIKESYHSMQKCLLNISYNLNRISSQASSDQFTSKLDYVRYSLAQLTLWADEVVKSSIDLDQSSSLGETLNIAMASSVATLTSSVIAWLVLLADDNEEGEENDQSKRDHISTRKESLRSYQTSKVGENNPARGKAEEDKENSDHVMNGLEKKDKDTNSNDSSSNLSKVYDRSNAAVLNNCLPRPLVDPSLYTYSAANRHNPIAAAIMDPYSHVPCLAQYPVAAGKYVIDGSYAIANASGLLIQQQQQPQQQQQQQQQQQHQQQNNSNIQRLSPVKFANNERQELSPSMLKRSPTCKYCGKSFSSNSYLKAHIRVHEIPDSFRCPECNKLFSCTSSLNKHIKDYHNGVISPDDEHADGEVADDDRTSNHSDTADHSKHIIASTHPIIHRSEEQSRQYYHSRNDSSIASNNEEDRQSRHFRYHANYYPNHLPSMNSSSHSDDDLFNNNNNNNNNNNSMEGNRSSLNQQNSQKLTTSTPSREKDGYRTIPINANNNSQHNSSNTTTTPTATSSNGDNHDSQDSAKRSSFISKVGEDESGKNYYECEICNKQFTSLTYMKAHVKMHNQPSSCVCKFCSKPFSCISAVNKHMKKYHEKEFYSFQKAVKQTQQQPQPAQHPLNHRETSNPSSKDVNMVNTITNHRFHPIEENHHLTATSNNTNGMAMTRQNHYDESNVPLFANQNSNQDQTQTRRDYQDKIVHPSNGHANENNHVNTNDDEEVENDAEIGKAARTEGHHRSNHVDINHHLVDAEPERGMITRRMITRQSKELLNDRGDDDQQELDMDKNDDNDINKDSAITVRSGRLRYSCDSCSKSFTSVYYLREHVKKHSGAYRCSYCRKFFSNKLSLKRHLIIQHGIDNPDSVDEVDVNISSNSESNGSQVYPCSTCSEKFNTVTELDEHNRQHGLIQCSLCSMTFTSAISLKKHLSTYHAKGTATRANDGHLDNMDTNTNANTNNNNVNHRNSSTSTNAINNYHDRDIQLSGSNHRPNENRLQNNNKNNDSQDIKPSKTNVHPITNPAASSLMNSVTNLKNQIHESNRHSKSTSDMRSHDSNSHRLDNNNNGDRYRHHHSNTRNNYYERNSHDKFTHPKRPASNGHYYHGNRRKRPRNFAGYY